MSSSRAVSPKVRANFRQACQSFFTACGRTSNSLNIHEKGNDASSYIWIFLHFQLSANSRLCACLPRCFLFCCIRPSPQRNLISPHGFLLGNGISLLVQLSLLILSLLFDNLLGFSFCSLLRCNGAQLCKEIKLFLLFFGKPFLELTTGDQLVIRVLSHKPRRELQPLTQSRTPPRQR